MKNRIQYLEGRLQSLQVGERFWYWFSPDSAELPLLIEQFTDPRGAAKLRKRAATLALSPPARVCIGIASVSEAGHIIFGTTIFEADMLQNLAAWVGQTVGAHPGLALLSGAQFVLVDSDGRVGDRYQEPALWAGVPRPTRAGTLDAAAQTLQNLSAGDDAWIWMSEGTQTPLLIVIPVQEDPQGERFSSEILIGRQRAGRADAGLRGTVRRLPSGDLLIATGDALLEPGSRLDAWLGAQGTVILTQLQDGEVVTRRRLPAPVDLSAQTDALQKILKGQPHKFWFTDAASSGQPLLLLDDQQQRLRKQVQQVAGPGTHVRGEVRVAKWGLEFRSKAAPPDFLQSLSAWVSAHHQQWPGLLTLVGARLIIRDSDGQPLKRVRDNDTWAALRAHQQRGST